MLLPEYERRLLGTFLRSHRERTVAARKRRRTPGLRREDVAELCGISPTWYAWIEQGRDISVSASTLARLASALQLSPAERAYLFELARQRDPERTDMRQPAEDPLRTLRPAVHAMNCPAYVLDPCWCAAAWNAPAGELFAGWFAREHRCLLDFMFLDEASRRLVPDWEDRARRLAAEFRADTARRPDDRALHAIVARLSLASRDFAGFWADHGVLAREGGRRLFAHPHLGLMRYEQVTLQPAAWPSHKLVMLIPGEGVAS